MGDFEARLNMRWRDRPGVASLVAGDAASPVCPQVLEKSILSGVRGPTEIEIGEPARGIRKLLKLR